MPDRLGSAYWRGRAEEAREQADKLRDGKAKAVLLDIANNYDQIAQQARARVEQRDPA